MRRFVKYNNLLIYFYLKTKRIYIGLPESEAIVELISNLLKNIKNNIEKDDLLRISKNLKGF